MPKLAGRMTNVQSFRDHILEAGILDPEGMHHEFVGGTHGRKLQFDRVKPGIPLYEEWTAVGADKIRSLCPDPEGLILLSVANGTNNITVDIAEELSNGVIGLQTEKVGLRKVRLTKIAKQVIRALQPVSVKVIEDASTDGTVVLTAVEGLWEQGVEDVSVLTTWQRRPALKLLEKAGIPYDAIIHQPLPTYSPEDCRKIGHCAAGWELIEHGK